MRQRRGRLPVVLVAGCAFLLAGILFAGQYAPSDQKTIEDLYALLVTPEGENRLELLDARLETLEAKLGDVEHKADLLYVEAIAHEEELARQTEAQNWALADIKFQIDDLSRQITEVKDAVQNCCP